MCLSQRQHVRSQVLGCSFDKSAVADICPVSVRLDSPDAASSVSEVTTAPSATTVIQRRRAIAPRCRRRPTAAATRPPPPTRRPADVTETT